MRFIKTLLVASLTLLTTLACSNAAPQEVVVVTATPTEILETSEVPTLHPSETPRPWPFSDSDGEWRVDVETDSLTGWEKIAAWVEARDSTYSMSNLLIVRCGYSKDDEAEALVAFGDEMEDLFRVEVEYRFDESDIETEYWPTSINKGAVFSPSPVEFIWQVMNSEKLAIREEGGQTLVFDVAGLPNALYPHRDKCDWIGNGAPTAKPTPTARPQNTRRATAPPASVGGAPLPEEWDGSEGIAATESSAEMTAHGARGLSGTLHLIQIERQTKITVTLDNAGPGPYSAAIRRGGCPDRGAQPGGAFDYILFDIVDGESISMVGTPAQFFQFSLSYVAVVDGTDSLNDPLISCGNIPSPLR